jgi:ABC-type multidrug transport system ATPase subunit
MAVIKVNNLSKHFGSLIAVNDLSFEVNQGEVFGFLGQNGSGKSTTIRMLLSLIHPTSGSIEIFGQALDANRSAIAERVGAIIERPDLYPYLTAQEHLELFAKLSKKKITTDQIAGTLTLVGLSARAKDKAQTFSLGMKQRLGIAIALVHNPQLIILDEPTNGLDPQGIADMRKLIIALSKEEGKTILVSSHLLAEIEQVATQILIIHKGKKVVAGSTQALLDPQNKIVQFKTLDDARALQVVQNSTYKPYLMDRKQGVFLKVPNTDIPQLNEFFIHAGIPIIGIEAKNSLEDYFLNITSN